MSLLYPSSGVEVFLEKFSCPSPELSVDARRQCFADSLLKTATECYAKCDIESQGWGTVRLFTKILRIGGAVQILDGWVPVPDVGILPCGEYEFGSSECRDFMLALPPVMYVAELDVGSEMTCAIGFSVGLYPVKNEAIHALLVVPLHGLQWRNYHYDFPVVVYNYHRPPSCTVLTKTAITDVLGHRMRDLLKISALVNNFKCVCTTDPYTFEFGMKSGGRMYVQLNNESGKGLVRVMWPWWTWRRSEIFALTSPKDFMNWAGKVR